MLSSILDTDKDFRHTQKLTTATRLLDENIFCSSDSTPSPKYSNENLTWIQRARNIITSEQSRKKHPESQFLSCSSPYHENMHVDRRISTDEISELWHNDLLCDKRSRGGVFTSPQDTGLGKSHRKIHVGSVPWRLSIRRMSSKIKELYNKNPLKSASQIRPVLASGIQVFNLRSLNLTSLHGFGSHPEVKKIYLQHNFLVSLEGWEHQPMLDELNLDDNCIENFRYCP